MAPAEATQAYLERIQITDVQLNIYMTVTPERAQPEAKPAKVELQAGIWEPLKGIPLAHRDIADTQGILTSSGSKVLRDAVSDYDVLLSERLQTAGSVLLGKPHMNEFATVIPGPHFAALEQDGAASTTPEDYVAVLGLQLPPVYVLARSGLIRVALSLIQPLFEVRRFEAYAWRYQLVRLLSLRLVARPYWTTDRNRQ